MLRTLETYYLLLMIYAVCGWFIEVTGKYFQYHRFINRGFLIGPYCPIYGWGAVAITILLKRYTYNPILLFIMSMVICSILEYATSYFMEKFFNARWWDYSQKKFNLNGRICLDTMIPFGLLGVFISYLSNPFFLSVLSKLNDTTLLIISSVTFIIYKIDNVVSAIVLFKVKGYNKKLAKDNTEELTKLVKEFLMQKSFLYRRLQKAYPNVKYLSKKIKEDAIRKIEDGKEKLEEQKEKIENLKIK